MTQVNFFHIGVGYQVILINEHDLVCIKNKPNATGLIVLDLMGAGPSQNELAAK